MPRPAPARKLKKYTLNLDQDAVERIQAALKKMPGKPSLSSMLSEQLPATADALEKMVRALEESNAAQMLEVLSDVQDKLDGKAIEARKAFKEKMQKKTDSLPQESKALDVPASKPKRQKKSA